MIYQRKHTAFTEGDIFSWNLWAGEKSTEWHQQW
jgi:hypothetical protein